VTIFVVGLLWLGNGITGKMDYVPVPDADQPLAIPRKIPAKGEVLVLSDKGDGLEDMCKQVLRIIASAGYRATLSARTKPAYGNGNQTPIIGPKNGRCFLLLLRGALDGQGMMDWVRQHARDFDGIIAVECQDTGLFSITTTPLCFVNGTMEPLPDAQRTIAENATTLTPMLPTCWPRHFKIFGPAIISWMDSLGLHEVPHGP
jgi:hypothetical protein